jgi:hypothetical protein
VTHTPRSIRALCFLFALAFSLPAFAAHPNARATSLKTRPLSATLYFSGSFGYQVGGGMAVVMADDVANTGAMTTGPLRFSLWWTPSAPFPAAGTNTAHYDLGTLAPGQHLTGVNSGQIPFLDPGHGCYYVTLVLEQFVSGNWQTEDYGNFSKRISSGGGCLMSFTAMPNTVASGGASTLQWTSGGTSVSIDNGLGSFSSNSSTVVHPTMTTTYTLTVFGTADGTPPSGQVVVTVSQAAPGITFSAAPTTINAGGSSTLTWSTTNATSVSIDNGIGAKPTSGMLSVSPGSTTTYTLTATGPGGMATSQATVTVNQLPGITFSAVPSTIPAGQSSLLSWSTTNATSVSIDNGIGSKPASGNASVSPTQTTTYTLTATGPGGMATAQATVTVNQPPTASFSAMPSIINPAGASTLSWSTTNATSVSIDNGVGSQPVNGMVVVHPSNTTTYTLTATGLGGMLTRQATVTVSAGPTISFAAMPGTVALGDSSTLSWSTTNATSVSIDNGIGSKPVNGSAVVAPVATTIYTLTAIGPGGMSSAQTVVTVSSPPDVTFIAQPGSGGTTRLVWSVLNATSITIDRGIGAVASNGTTTVHPTVTTTYTLTADGPGGTTVKKVTVGVGAKHRAARH